MAQQPVRSRDPERTIRRRDTLAQVANDAIDVSVGAAAGGAMGILAGPFGVVAGAALGAVAGGLLGHEADRERHERDLHDRELDDIDVEEEFFGRPRALGASTDGMFHEHGTFMAMEVLKREHRVIERVLMALETWADEIGSPDGFDDRYEASRFVQFFRNFVERRHHDKEENIVFDAIDGTRERSPIAAIVHEHDVLRSLVCELDELAARPHRWTQGERLRVAETARTYAELLRGHIIKEDTVLFPLAEGRLSLATRASIDQRFREFEARYSDEQRAAIDRLATSLVTVHA